MSRRYDHLADEELAAIVIEEISALESHGVRLPKGWRHQPISLSYLDGLHELALDQFKKMLKNSMPERSIPQSERRDDPS